MMEDYWMNFSDTSTCDLLSVLTLFFGYTIVTLSISFIKQVFNQFTTSDTCLLFCLEIPQSKTLTTVLFQIIISGDLK